MHRLAVLFTALLLACDGGSDTPPDAAADAPPDAPTCQRAEVETALAARLDAALTDPALAASQDITVLLETRDGRRFTYTHGASTPTTRYESASTSKLVSAAVLLDLVDRGTLALTTKASDLIPAWTDPGVTLHHLLSFTSGYADEPLCINQANASFERCVETIFTSNEATHKPPGAAYHYSGTHLQVAGLMAIEALDVAGWSDVFAAWQARTGLFPTGAYDLPSAGNPRIAGGMHWTAEEYLAFLRALAQGTLLEDATRTALFANQRGAATVDASPAWDQIGEDWSYGYGNWLECATATQPGSFDCGAGHRNSSAGAYGAYPFIDFDRAYVGILAQQGQLGTGFMGVLLLRAAQAEIDAWVDCE